MINIVNELPDTKTIVLIGGTAAFAGLIIPRKHGPWRIFTRLRAVLVEGTFLGTVVRCPFCMAWWTALAVALLLRVFPRLSVLLVPMAGTGVAYALMALCGVAPSSDEGIE